MILQSCGEHGWEVLYTFHFFLSSISFPVSLVIYSFNILIINLLLKKRSLQFLLSSPNPSSTSYKSYLNHNLWSYISRDSIISAPKIEYLLSYKKNKNDPIYFSLIEIKNFVALSIHSPGIFAKLKQKPIIARWACHFTFNRNIY